MQSWTSLINDFFYMIDNEWNNYYITL